MAIKVFCGTVTLNGYFGNPVEGFQIQVPYSVFQSYGGDNNAPQSYSSSTVIDIPVNGTSVDVLSAAFTNIVADCLAQGYDAPAMADVFVTVPAQLSSMLQPPVFA